MQLHPLSITNESIVQEKRLNYDFFHLLHTQQKCRNRFFTSLPSHHLSAALSPNTGGIWGGLWENVTAAELLYIFCPPYAYLHLASPLTHIWKKHSVTILSLSQVLGLYYYTKPKYGNEYQVSTADLYLYVDYNESIESIEWDLRNSICSY